jgi:hypothetical protein
MNGVDRSSGSHALADLQRRTAEAIPSKAAAWSELLLSEIRPGGTLDAAGALDVYRGGYFARLTEQLGETYGTVWRVLGDAGFFAVSERYIAATPSSSYNLSDYGRAFPAWLEGQPEACEHAFLAELARFEWTFHEAFHAPRHDPVSAADLAALDDLSGVALELGPSVRIVATERAVYELFRRRNDESAPDIDIERPQWALIFRQDGDMMAREIDTGSARVLGALARGQAVDEAIEAAAEADPSFGADDVARVFEMLARCGLVARAHRR